MGKELTTKVIKKAHKKQPKKDKKIDINKELLTNKNYKNAEKLYKNIEYEKAFKIYTMLTVKYSRCKKIYKRLIECYTKDFSYREKNIEFTSVLDEFINKYKELCSKAELKSLITKLELYKKVKVSDGHSKFLIIAFLGFFGVHKFMEKKYVKGIIYLCTFGLFGIGVLYDLICDYSDYEDTKQLNIYRCIIACLFVIIGLLRIKTYNFYYFILVGIILCPIVYSKLLKLIPNFIKCIVIIILCFLGLKVAPEINYTPTELLGTWKTKNENTNIKELKVDLEHTVIKFDGIDSQKGSNDYNTENDVLTISVNNKTFYKFKLNKKNKEICLYNESNKCVVSFKK